MAKVLIKKLDSSVELPAYKTEGASGVDLMALIKEPINLKPNSSCLVPTGLAVAFSSDFLINEMGSPTMLLGFSIGQKSSGNYL